MEFVYVLVGANGTEWEDIIIFLSKEDAIAESKKYPNKKVAIFMKTDKPGYIPTYDYYHNGNYVQSFHSN